MIKNRTFYVSLFLNIVYGLLLLNIASGILAIMNYLNVPSQFSLTLVAVYFLLELYLFFSYLSSPGILLLSTISIIPYLVIKKIHIKDIPDIPRRLKTGISDISECFRGKTKNEYLLSPIDGLASDRSGNTLQK